MSEIIKNVYLEPGKTYLLTVNLETSNNESPVIKYPKQNISNPSINYTEYSKLRIGEIFSDVFVATDYGQVIFSIDDAGIVIKEMILEDVGSISKIEDYVNGSSVNSVDRNNLGNTSLSPMEFTKKDFLSSDLNLIGNWNGSDSYSVDDVVKFGFSYVDNDGNAMYDLAHYKCVSVNSNEIPILKVRDVNGDSLVVDLETSAFNSSSNVIDLGVEVPEGISMTMKTIGTLPSGLVDDFKYYAINVTGTQIQISIEQNGSAVSFSDVGTGMHSISVLDTVNSIYWKKFVSFKPEFYTSYVDGHSGQWLPTSTYDVDDIVIYPYGESTDVYYFKSKTASNLNNAPSDNSDAESPVLDSTNWERITHFRPATIEDESNSRLAGPDYTFDGDEYLNVEGHRQRNYTDEDVVDFLSSKLGQEIHFGNGTFFNWLDVNGVNGSVDLTSSSPTNTPVSTFGSNVISERARRFGPQDGLMTTIDVNRERMYTQWGIGTNVSSTNQENSNGTRSAFVKNYPTEYNDNDVAASGHLQSKFDGINDSKTIEFGIELNTVEVNSSPLKIFDVTRAFDYKNKWHNNIELDLNYSRYDFIIAGKNKIRIENAVADYPIDKILDLTMDDGDTFERLKVIASSFDGTDTWLTFDRNLSRIITEEPPVDEIDSLTNVNTTNNTITMSGVNRIADDITVILTGSGVQNIDTIDDSTLYYVIESTGVPSTFKLALTKDGSEINLVSGTSGLVGDIEIHKVQPSTGTIVSGMVGRHHISINHDMKMVSSDDFSTLETSLGELVTQSLLRSVTVDGIIKYYYKPATAETLSPTTGVNSVTYDYVDGGDTYSYIFSHLSANGADIKTYVDQNINLLPVPIDAVDNTADLELLYVSNGNHPVPDGTEITYSKKTFVHLPADNIKDGQILDLSISMPYEDAGDSSSMWSSSLSNIAAYKNFITQPRAYVFSGRKSCDGEEELFVYSDKFVSYNDSFWTDTVTPDTTNNSYSNNQLTNTTELDFPDSAGIPTIMARDVSTSPITGEWAELIGVKLNIDLKKFLIEYSTLSLSPAIDVIAQYKLGNLFGELYLEVSDVGGYAQFEIFFRINGDVSTDTTLALYDTSTELIGRKEIEFVYKVEKDGTGTKHTLSASGLSSDTIYTIASGGEDGGDISVSQSILNVKNSSNIVLMKIVPVISCFSVKSTVEFDGNISGLSESDNPYMFSEYPESEFSTNTNIYNQSYLNNDYIQSNDKRVLLATVYPTATGKFGLRMNNNPSARLVYWNILGINAYPGSPAHRAYNTLRKAVTIGEEDQNAPVQYLRMSQFPITLANVARLGEGTFANGVWQESASNQNFSYGIYESVRPRLPGTTRPDSSDISSDKYFINTDDNNNLTSYNYMANKAHIELLKMFSKSSICSNDFIDGNGDPVNDLLSDYGISLKMPYNFATGDDIFSHGSISITDGDISIVNDTIDLGVDTYSQGNPIQFSTVNGFQINSVAVSTSDIYYVFNPSGTTVQLASSPDSESPLNITSTGTGNIIVEPLNRFFTLDDTVRNENRSLTSWIRKPVHIPDDILANDPAFQIGALSNEMLDSGNVTDNEGALIEFYETYNTIATGYNVNKDSVIGSDKSANDFKNPDQYNIESFGIGVGLMNLNPDNYKLHSEIWNAIYTVDTLERYQEGGVADRAYDFYNSIEYTMRASTNMFSLGGFYFYHDSDINSENYAIESPSYDPVSDGGFPASISSGDEYDTFINAIALDPLAKYFYDSGNSYVTIYSEPVNATQEEQYRIDFLKKYIKSFSNKLPLRFYDSLRTIAKGDESSSISTLQKKNLDVFFDGILATVDSSVDVVKNDFILSDNLIYVESNQATAQLTDANSSYINYSTKAYTDPFDAVNISLDMSSQGRSIEPLFVFEKAQKTYIRMDMRFIFSEEAGRWLTLNYQQSPNTYLSPSFGAKALSHKEQSIKLPARSGESAEDYVGDFIEIECSTLPGFTYILQCDDYDKVFPGMIISGNGVEVEDKIYVVETYSSGYIVLSGNVPATVPVNFRFYSYDNLWIPNANYGETINSLVSIERDKWKTVPYYKMSPLEFNKYCIPFMGAVNRDYTNIPNGEYFKIDETHTSDDDLKVSGNQDVFRIGKISDASALELGSPSDVNGTPSGDMIGLPLPWKTFWHIRPCSTSAYGTDVPSKTSIAGGTIGEPVDTDVPSKPSRAGGTIGEPVQGNMYGFPDISNLSYRIPYHDLVDLNWLTDVSDEDF